MNHYALTGASFPMKISGKEFAAYSLSDSDYIELDAFIQKQVLETAKIAYQDLQGQERMEMQQAAITSAARSGWGTPEGGRIMNTVPGVLRLGWQMIRRDSNITFEAFTLLARPKNDNQQLSDNLLEIDKCFTILNMSIDEDDEPEEDSSEESKRGEEQTP